jgi:hypothetical protein
MAINAGGMVCARYSGSQRHSSLDRGRILAVHVEKVAELINAFLGKCHDAVIAESADPNDAILGLHGDGNLVQQIFVDAELLGDGGDDCDQEDFVALHGQLALVLLYDGQAGSRREA